MDTHIKLLLGTLISGVVAGAVAIAVILGTLYLVPVIVLAFFFAVSWRTSEFETLGKRLQTVSFVFFSLALLSWLVK